MSSNILISELKTKILKLDKCLVNSPDFDICYNEVMLENDYELNHYVDSNINNYSSSFRY